MNIHNLIIDTSSDEEEKSLENQFKEIIVDTFEIKLHHFDKFTYSDDYLTKFNKFKSFNYHGRNIQIDEELHHRQILFQEIYLQILPLMKEIYDYELRKIIIRKKQLAWGLYLETLNVLTDKRECLTILFDKLFELFQF